MKFKTGDAVIVRDATIWSANVLRGKDYIGITGTINFVDVFGTDEFASVKLDKEVNGKTTAAFLTKDLEHNIANKIQDLLDIL